MSLPRISARLGQKAALSVNFYRNGALSDPFGLQKIEIYKSQVLPHNLVATVPVVSRIDPTYPSPITKLGVGQYQLDYTIPSTFAAPDIYYDLWYYFGIDPLLGGTIPADLNNPAFASQVLTSCNRFWVYPDGWVVSDKLQSIRLAFEPLDQKFNQPEVRPLEVGMMPTPLYDYNYNLIMPLLPMIVATIHIETRNKEILVVNDAMDVGLRQGAYRSNPFVLRYNLDTNQFLIGTYKYRVTVRLPDGTTRTSPDFVFTVC
jgi:hypothetical protein